MRHQWIRKLLWVVMLGMSVPVMAQAEQKTLKIGVMNDQSGPYADLGGPGSVTAARLAVQDSGLLEKGWNIEILPADHQNKADIAASITRKWFDADGVDAVADLVNSAAALAVSHIAQEQNKVLLASGPATSDLTGKACSPNTVHWTSDTWAFAHGTGRAAVKSGADSWFFLTADYAFGHALERDTANVVLENGGKVLGRVRVPTGTSDFASYLLQAQSSGAKVVGLANSGGDTINAIKQAQEFGIIAGGQKIAGLLLYVSDIHALGLKAANGIVLISPFYWDMNDGTRAFSRRFGEQMKGAMPTMIHAGTYSAVLHYLKAVEQVGSSKDGKKIMETMKAMPTQDALFGEGRIRADGRKIHNMYLFEVKKPEESSGPWDYYKYVAAVPAEEAFRPMEEGGCYLVEGVRKEG